VQDGSARLLPGESAPGFLAPAAREPSVPGRSTFHLAEVAMSRPLLFTGLIVTRPARSWRSLRRVVMTVFRRT